MSHFQDLCRSLEQQVKDAHDDMDEYTESTKEFQQELETELDRIDKSEKGMQIALEAAENDKDEWKVGTHDGTCTIPAGARSVG